jgi:hypothetical protein
MIGSKQAHLMWYWWRNRLSTSSSLFHEASKVRERGGVWSNTLQPVMQSTHIHGSRSDDMLKMSPRLSNVTRAAQPHPTTPVLATWDIRSNTCALTMSFTPIFSSLST